MIHNQFYSITAELSLEATRFCLLKNIYQHCWPLTQHSFSVWEHLEDSEDLPTQHSHSILNELYLSRRMFAHNKTVFNPTLKKSMNQAVTRGGDAGSGFHDKQKRHEGLHTNHRTPTDHSWQKIRTDWRHKTKTLKYRSKPQTNQNT